MRIAQLFTGAPECADLGIAQVPRPGRLFADEGLAIDVVAGVVLQTEALPLDRPAEQATRQGQQGVRLIRPARLQLFTQQLYLAAGDLGDLASAPAWNQFTAKRNLSIMAAPLLGQLLADEIFGDAGKRVGLLPQLRRPLALNLVSWIDSTTEEF